MSKLTEKITNNVFANILPPIRQMIRQKNRTTEQYRYLYQSFNGKLTAPSSIMLPLGPKLSRTASTKPDIYNPQANTLATKNKNPILPPNSGPNARLIISVTLVKAKQQRVFNNDINSYMVDFVKCLKMIYIFVIYHH